MRYFERQPLDPRIQTLLDAKTSKEWGTLTDNQRKEIVKQLMLSQKSLCAYCECLISDEEREHHIEHFEERHDTPDKIFDYTNLLLSCEGNKQPTTKPESVATAMLRKSNISCGNGKEKSRHQNIGIDYLLLLNPTDKHTSALFSYENGAIHPSKQCTTFLQLQQVDYTIKRLNLHADRLTEAREERINDVNIFLDGLPEDLQKVYIERLLDETQDKLEPYFSTIKDNFGFILL